jgi:hypothetical protein
MDPESLKAFEDSHKGLPSEAKVSPGDPPDRSPLWNLDDKTLYMVLLNPMGGMDVGGVIGRFEPQNDISTQFGREMKTRALKREYSRQGGGEWHVDPSLGYTEDINIENSRIYPIKFSVSGGRRRKTRRRMIKKRRTRSKRPSKA